MLQSSGFQNQSHLHQSCSSHLVWILAPGVVQSSIGDQRLDGVRYQCKDPLEGWLITGVFIDKGSDGTLIMRPADAAMGVQELPELVEGPSRQECTE